jgi:cytochrome oxidase Cu insertion factor (SCO1/SenC/PrrC family)
MEAGATPFAPRRHGLWRGVVIAVAAAAAVGALTGFVAHLILAPRSSTAAAPALPELHGQATWPAGKHPAPLFTLHNVLGGSTSLSSTSGRPTLIAFLDSRCKTLCPVIGGQIGDIQRSLPSAARPRVLVVSVDPAGDTPASVRTALRHWHAAPGWQWLSGTGPQLAKVWRAYGIDVRVTKAGDIAHGAAIYLVDKRGYERAGYLAPLLPNFVALDIRRVEADAA